MQAGGEPVGDVLMSFPCEWVEYMHQEIGTTLKTYPGCLPLGAISNENSSLKQRPPVRLPPALAEILDTGEDGLQVLRLDSGYERLAEKKPFIRASRRRESLARKCHVLALLEGFGGLVCCSDAEEPSIDLDRGMASCSRDKRTNFEVFS